MQLFRLFGIDVKAEPMAWGLLAMVTLSMTQLFAHISGASLPVCLLIGFTLGVGQILSIVAHEYGHSLVARLFKVEVRDIYIHLFGGAAVMSNAFPSARAERYIALAGPFVSMLLAGVFIGLSVLTESAPLLSKALVLTGVGNLILGIFNMIPCFPMDGGRVLRATIWDLTGKYGLATRVASYVGYAFAAYVIGTGFLMMLGLTVPLFGSGVASGLWQMIFGGFICWLNYSELKRLPKSIPSTNPEQRFKNQEIE